MRNSRTGWPRAALRQLPGWQHIRRRHVAIPKEIDDAARSGSASYSLQVQVNYVSDVGTVENVDTVVPVSDTTFVGNVDEDTVAVLVQVPLGTANPPGGNPSFNTTVELLETQ